VRPAKSALYKGNEVRFDQNVVKNIDTLFDLPFFYFLTIKPILPMVVMVIMVIVVMRVVWMDGCLLLSAYNGR
jgi:hypothetical protein